MDIGTAAEGVAEVGRIMVWLTMFGAMIVVGFAVFVCWSFYVAYYRRVGPRWIFALFLIEAVGLAIVWGVFRIVAS